jgi:hypothetical protein
MTGGICQADAGRECGVRQGRCRQGNGPEMVTAAEVGSYVFCAEAGRLEHVLGLEPWNWAALKAGTRHRVHRDRIRVVQQRPRRASFPFGSYSWAGRKAPSFSTSSFFTKRIPPRRKVIDTRGRPDARALRPVTSQAAPGGCDNARRGPESAGSRLGPIFPRKVGHRGGRSAIILT